MAKLEKMVGTLAFHDKLVRELELAENGVAQINAVLRFLIATGVANETTAPLMSLLGRLTDEGLRDGRAGRPPRPIARTMVFAVCAAAVTARKERRRSTIPEALRAAGSEAGIDPDAIKNFRDNVNRYVESEFAISAYEEALAEMRDLDDLTISERVRSLAGIC